MRLNPNSVLLYFLSERLGRSADRLELEPKLRLTAEKGEVPALSDIEKREIIDFWRPISGKKLNLDYWRFYKSYGVMNPMLVPDNTYWSKIIRSLNPVSLTRTYINKSLYPIIFKGLRQPEILVNVINGIPYDGKMNIMSYEKVYDKLNNYGDDVIIKPTTATSGGSGVSIIRSNASLDEIKSLLRLYGKNYICQGVVRQCVSTAAFNESSLNTFRVNTLNLNGRITCENLMMRHGLDGSVVDNFAKGGVLCGMTTDGNFNGNNYNTRFERLSHFPNGIKYDTLSVPSIGNVIATAIESHRRFMPNIGHAAWDFAIDENENPVMIEVNLMLPGIMGEQLTAGTPIFGNRTEEVVKLAMNRFKSLSWTEFVGGWQ